MKFYQIIPSVMLMLLAASCSNAGERTSGKGPGSGDTLVYSFPVNYLKSLDTLREENKYPISSYQEMLDLFTKLNYTPEAWQDGIREVPRVYLTIIGPNWGTRTTQEISVLLKKRIFFRGLAPMILKSNELILKDRRRLERIREGFTGEESIAEADRVFVRKLAALYRAEAGTAITAPLLDALLVKVDIVPPSLALAQGAEESGWGTSRFAAQGNAIYGQWTWGKDAIVPEQQRKALGNYGIAAFESVQESVSAYMLNINTHNAYKGLREKRAELRRQGAKITGYILAGQLSSYSERGEEYVKGLRGLMEYNRLEPADDAYLSEMTPIYFIPAEE